MWIFILLRVMLILHFWISAVVEQVYQTEVNNEYVIRGNSAILKCSIPSFLSDFVSVVSWVDNSGNVYNAITYDLASGSSASYGN